MSAVIGILNRTAVTLAADSAYTLSNGKIINKADKIFALSKHHPVGVTIHNSDSFMGTPWEIIIKMYRQQLKDKCFDKLEMYQEDFIKYVHDQNFFCNSDNEKAYLEYYIQKVVGRITELFNDFKHIVKIDVPSDRSLKELEFIKYVAREALTQASNYKETLPEFTDYTMESFREEADLIFQNVLSSYFEEQTKIKADDELKDLLVNLCYSELIYNEAYNTDYTGLSFAGYGENEIFPSLIAIEIYFGFSKRLRYFKNINKSAQITHFQPSAIRTFAQIDVMSTILDGVAPDLKETYSLIFKDFLNAFDEILLDNYGNDKGDLMFLLQRIDKKRLVKTFEDTMEEAIIRKYTGPLVQSVAILSKEDMGEMAESLIYLTYLQRRMTNAQESVGGPVDVAVLSKTDGFIWLKRKHYFKADLNPYFFHKH